MASIASPTRRRARSPRANRIGGTELESTTIHHLRFAGDTVYAATLRGVYSHSVSGPAATPWKLLFAPSPSYLPGGADSGAQNAGYQNIVNDLAVDPKNAKHLIAAAGWRAGAAYNGFYESKDAGATWTKINPGGAINPKDIGYATFAFAADGSKLYVMNESVNLYNQLTGTKAANTLLDGIYVSNTGDPAGPWNRIADSTKLANSGSALKQSIGGKGYGPGVQAWYNQFLAVDPTNADHVYAGLEEVYETQNGGASWTTTGPYWNFYFSCWRPDSLYPPNGNVGCPQSTHSDQHSVAFGTVGGKAYVYVGNDGGVYRRPANGTVNRNGNGTDWESLNDGTIDALQYYYVGVGKLNADDAARPDLNTGGDSVLVSGGLQDNGGSLIRPGSPKMVSNFGGDGGDVLVDPADGCNIVQEYVYLSMRVTKTCANPGPGHPNAFLDLSQCDDDRHLAARRECAVHRTVHGERQEHQSVAGCRHEPLVPGQGLRHHLGLAVAEGVLTAVRRPRRSPRSRTPATARSRRGAARARTAARPSPAALSSARSPAERGRSSRSRSRPTSRTATCRVRRSTRRTRTI